MRWVLVVLPLISGQPIWEDAKSFEVSEQACVERQKQRDSDRVIMFCIKTDFGEELLR